MLTQFLSRLGRGEITVRNVVSGELRISLGDKVYFLGTGQSLTVTDLATTEQLRKSAELRSLIMRGFLVLERAKT